MKHTRTVFITTIKHFFHTTLVLLDELQMILNDLSWSGMIMGTFTY